MRIPPFLRQAVPPGWYLRAVVLHDYFRGEPELRLLRQLVEPARNAVDAGANYGVYSYLLSRLVPQVYAFEPHPELVTFLRRSVRKNVAVIPRALSDHAGSAQLSIPVQNNSEIHGQGSLQTPAGSTSLHTFTVETITLDSQNLDNIGFIKIDVEGHELAVLRGAAHTLQTCRPRLLIEIERRHIGDKIQAEFDTVRGLGYRGWFYCAGQRFPLEEFDLDRLQPLLQTDAIPATYVQNFIFVHAQDGFMPPAHLG